MKSLIALSVLFSASAFAYTPEHEINVLSNKTVRLTVYAEENASTAVCTYKMSWFEGLTFKKHWGKFTLSAGDVKNFEVKNDIATKIQHTSASVECDYIDG